MYIFSFIFYVLLYLACTNMISKVIMSKIFSTYIFFKTEGFALGGLLQKKTES